MPSLLATGAAIFLMPLRWFYWDAAMGREPKYEVLTGYMPVRELLKRLGIPHGEIRAYISDDPTHPTYIRRYQIGETVGSRTYVVVRSDDLPAFYRRFLTYHFHHPGTILDELRLHQIYAKRAGRWTWKELAVAFGMPEARVKAWVATLETGMDFNKRRRVDRLLLCLKLAEEFGVPVPDLSTKGAELREKKRAERAAKVASKPKPRPTPFPTVAQRTAATRRAGRISKRNYWAERDGKIVPYGQPDDARRG